MPAESSGHREHKLQALTGALMSILHRGDGTDQDTLPCLSLSPNEISLQSPSTKYQF